MFLIISNFLHAWNLFLDGFFWVDSEAVSWDVVPQSTQVDFWPEKEVLVRRKSTWLFKKLFFECLSVSCPDYELLLQTTFTWWNVRKVQTLTRSPEWFLQTAFPFNTFLSTTWPKHQQLLRLWRGLKENPFSAPLVQKLLFSFVWVTSGVWDEDLNPELSLCKQAVIQTPNDFFLSAGKS